MKTVAILLAFATLASAGQSWFQAATDMFKIQRDELGNPTGMEFNCPLTDDSMAMNRNGLNITFFTGTQIKVSRDGDIQVYQPNSNSTGEVRLTDREISSLGKTTQSLARALATIGGGVASELGGRVAEQVRDLLRNIEPRDLMNLAIQGISVSNPGLGLALGFLNQNPAILEQFARVLATPGLDLSSLGLNLGSLNLAPGLGDILGNNRYTPEINYGRDGNDWNLRLPNVNGRLENRRGNNEFNIRLPSVNGRVDDRDSGIGLGIGNFFNRVVNTGRNIADSIRNAGPIGIKVEAEE